MKWAENERMQPMVGDESDRVSKRRESKLKGDDRSCWRGLGEFNKVRGRLKGRQEKSNGVNWGGQTELEQRARQV